MLCYCYFGDCINNESHIESSVEAYHIHISEATHNQLDRLVVYCCEERGLTQFKVQLLPGVFYVVIYAIRWPVCSTNSQHFVKSHAFTTGKTAVFYDIQIRGLLEKYPTFGRKKETGLLGALDT